MTDDTPMNHDTPLTDDAPPTAGARPSRGRDRFTLSDGWARLIMAVVLLGALVALVFTVKAATTGNDRTSQSKPAFVDRLIPESGSEVLRQAGVGIDVASGYDAYLIVNGTEIRTVRDGLIKDLGTGLIQYIPGPGKPVSRLNPERNCVLAMVWKQSEGERTALPVSWCFTAA